MSFINRINKQFKQNNNEQVRFQSGMTSQQKFHSISESVLSSLDHTRQTIKGCPMHPKISKKCRKCQEVEKNHAVAKQQQQIQLEEQFPELIKINTSNMKSHFNQKLQKNIEDTPLLKSKLRQIHTIRDLVNDLTSDQISINAYITGSNDTPTDFFCYFYRTAELRPTRQQLSIMLKANNVNVRCLALLYLRVYADPWLVYGCMCHNFKDHKLLSTVTIGEYAMRLFDQEQLNHGGFRIPRLPIKIQKAIQKKINKINEDRQREFQRQRERSRSRQRKRRVLVEQAQNNRKLSRKRSSSRSVSSQQHEIKEQNGPLEPILTLKQKIRLMQQKKAAQSRRLAVLQSYKTQNANKLQSEQQAYSENDSVQKFHVG